MHDFLVFRSLKANKAYLGVTPGIRIKTDYWAIRVQKIIDLERIEIFERIRDLRFYKNQLYLFMEDTPSIGVIKIN